MADALECGDRTECRKTEPRFNRAEADLHNLWPALDRLNSSRGKRLFGEIGDGSKTAPRVITIGQNTFRCNFENDGDVVEPRRIVRGNLARSIFYMCEEYGFPVDAQMLELLKRWNVEDLPTQGERRRNERIEKRQGTRNRFIDDPTAAEGLACASP